MTMQCSACVDQQTWQSLFGPDWIQIHASKKAGAKLVFVIKNTTDDDLVVVRNDVDVDQFQKIEVPKIGIFAYHPYWEDPAFSQFFTSILAYGPHQVLRYRPGKRITVSVDHPQLGAIVVKGIVNGGTSVGLNQSSIWKHREELKFRVSRPLKSTAPVNVAVQQKLDGGPLSFDNIKDSNALSTRIADALWSLHQSDAVFPETFSAVEQHQRSARYIDLISKNMPKLAGELCALHARLEQYRKLIERNSLKLVPIHGSPHTLQWLDGDTLGLIDFDRAAMGHRELDIATFVCEWDYEPGEIADAVKGAFLSHYEDIDHDALAFYRAHKHLAKAFKASKRPDHNGAFQKTQRNLRNAINLLD